MILFVVSLLLVLIATYSLGGAFRDNDQAMFVFGGLELARDHASPVNAPFYNYDKQWGTYLLLDLLFRTFPTADPILSGNALQVALLLPSIVLCIRVISRGYGTPLSLFLPLLLSPAIVLYLPFLAPASISLGFLLLALAVLRSDWRRGRVFVVPLFMALASSCRGDATLVAPIMILTSVPRGPVLSVLKSRMAWSVSAAAVLPVAVGKMIDARREPDLAGLYFHLPVFGAFIIFSLGIGTLLVLGLLAVAQFRAVRDCKVARPFYITQYAAMLMPMLFYWPQLYSPRYFFLTIVSALFVVSSRRTLVYLRHVPQSFSYLVVALACLPWLFGFQIPALDHIRPTLGPATTFPTADGEFPIGAYGSFSIDLVGKDHFDLDHNQKTWDSARLVDYKPCADGNVPIINSPMRNYLMLAVALEGKRPLFVRTVADSTCGVAYLDSRSVVRNDLPADALSNANLTIVSNRPELGRPILEAERGFPLSTSAKRFLVLPRLLRGSDAEVFVGWGVNEPPPSKLKLLPQYVYLLFSDSNDCKTIQQPSLERLSGADGVCFRWRGSSGQSLTTGDISDFAGWAHTVFPEYMKK